MATVAAGRRSASPARAPLRWLAAMLGHFTFVIAGIPVQLAALAALALPWILSVFVPVSFGKAAVAVGVVATLIRALASVCLVLLVRVPLTFIQGHRCWSLLGIDIPPSPPAPGVPLWRRVVGSLRSEAAWRQLGYHLVVGPAIALGGLLTLGMLAGGIGLVASLYSKLGVAQPLGPKAKALLSAAGVAVLLVAPAVAMIVTRLDTKASILLLGPSRALELERRVETLSQSRAGVVDAADTERRRIERDLHDGAQQRLVSLAMNLGLARESMTDLPGPARQVIAEAHEEAKEALAELRDLVRGLHPAVLDDRGLDAALSGIAARAPLPVTLTVTVLKRASPTVEAVAYFVVSECLANIARHSSASRAAIEVRRAGSVLCVRVTDDGVGGADAARGTGLASLAQRARSVDGTMHIESPAGGPTTVTVELPCES
jgi:signal transduction histidine kinase